jgi:secreted PhoX family phosphatase
MKRRHFLAAGSAAALSTGLALWFRALSKEPSEGKLPRARGLVADPRGLIDLRKGFTYSVISRAGQLMSDGYRVPAAPDAMGCFDLGGGRWALMRNHELDASMFAYGPYASGMKPPPEAYDPRAAGGVTRVVLDSSGKVLGQNLVLVGTARNCAGGMSPWGWLTCEESVEPGHGYVFVCPIDAERVQRPRRISAYGRFLHEAAAVDPATNAVYLTEDRMDGCLYRFLPESPSEPHGKGRLQAMAVKAAPRFQLGQRLEPAATFEVHWVDVPAERGERDQLRAAAHDLGAAVVVRGEGIVALEDGFAFTSTEGGPIRGGQVFHLAPTLDGGTLRLLAQSEDTAVLDMPDNITATPWGDYLVCEDNHATVHLRLITKEGAIVPFARNAVSRSEFAGACFSPDGSTLFVNIQSDGLTLAIRGPFDQLKNVT